MPSVWRTRRVFPSSEVSLPFSRFDTKLIPTPEKRASFDWVYPLRFRSSRTMRPSSCAVAYVVVKTSIHAYEGIPTLLLVFHSYA